MEDSEEQHSKTTSSSYHQYCLFQFDLSETNLVNAHYLTQFVLSISTTTTTTITVYFNKVVFPSVLGSTSPMRWRESVEKDMRRKGVEKEDAAD